LLEAVNFIFARNVDTLSCIQFTAQIRNIVFKLFNLVMAVSMVSNGSVEVILTAAVDINSLLQLISTGVVLRSGFF